MTRSWLRYFYVPLLSSMGKMTILSSRLSNVSCWRNHTNVVHRKVITFWLHCVLVNRHVTLTLLQPTLFSIPPTSFLKTMAGPKEIHQSATFTWLPSPFVPLLITDTVAAGSLDVSFSNDSQFEIWAPNFMDQLDYGMDGDGRNGPTASVTTTSRWLVTWIILYF